LPVVGFDRRPEQIKAGPGTKVNYAQIARFAKLRTMGDKPVASGPKWAMVLFAIAALQRSKADIRAKQPNPKPDHLSQFANLSF